MPLPAENKIFLSVDMDEWFNISWATGTTNSKWPNHQTFFRDYYRSDKPTGEMLPMADSILELFATHQVKATFFFTAQIASYYPQLVNKIVQLGHEIGCHNYFHIVYGTQEETRFKEDVVKAKEYLENLTGEQIIGYRAPNSCIHNYMIPILLAAGFAYDSSLTPARSVPGKYGGGFDKAPINPFILDVTDFGKVGHSGLWEFPWPVFPGLRLPAGSGNTSRLLGYGYSTTALDHALRSGDSAYYFHPFELAPLPHIDGIPLLGRLLMIRCGQPYQRLLTRLLDRYRGRFTTGRDLCNRLNRQ